MLMRSVTTMLVLVYYGTSISWYVSYYHKHTYSVVYATYYRTLLFIILVLLLGMYVTSLAFVTPVLVVHVSVLCSYHC